MFGVLVNCLAIAAGALLGLSFKKFITRQMGEHIEVALGFCTIAIGLKMALRFENVLLLVLSLAVGGILGHLWKIEDRSAWMAQKLQKKFSTKGDSQFALGCSMASILFCTGAMAVVGSINAGLSSDYEVLFAKATLDGVISISFGSIYGIGVVFSAIPVFIYQGAIVLLASQLKILSNPSILNDISGVGGVLVMMIGMNLSKIKRVPVGDYLPAIPLVIIAASLLTFW
jgi:uncharacterized protein